MKTIRNNSRNISVSIITSTNNINISEIEEELCYDIKNCFYLKNGDELRIFQRSSYIEIYLRRDTDSNTPLEFFKEYPQYNSLYKLESLDKEIRESIYDFFTFFIPGQQKIDAQVGYIDIKEEDIQPKVYLDLIFEELLDRTV